MEQFTEEEQQGEFEIEEDGYGDDHVPQYKPEFYIHEEREKCICGLWVVFFLTLVSFVVGGTLYVNQVFFVVKDPEPTFSTADILPGCRHDFFHEPKAFNESQRICAARNSHLVVFNNSVENSRFNEFVTTTFQPFVRNQTTDQWKRRGLQIWTGIRIIFQASKTTQLDWPDRMECPMEMLKFYADSQEDRLCHVTTMERMRQYRKAMQSRRANKQFIVKDFTGQFENSLNETGCWQIRILQENESLLLPFVCKSGSPIIVPTIAPINPN